MPDPELDTSRTSLARVVNPQALIERAIEHGAGIETMERLLALAKEVRTIQAREAWYEAMATFQRTCPVIRKTSTAKISSSRGSYSYRFAPLDEIVSKIQPIMGPLGLSISWRSRVEADKVVVSCRVSHTLGHHEESGEIAMPVVARSEDAMGANPAQRVGIASTYAKRYSLLGIIGMAPEDDDDAGGQEESGRGAPPAGDGTGTTGVGEGPITEQQNKRFYAIAREHKWGDSEIYDLLTSYRIAAVKEITRNVYDELVNKLKAGPPKGSGGQGTLA